MFHARSVASLLGALITSAVAAQPGVVVIGTSPDDLSADGRGTMGALYNASIGRYFIYRFNRGFGATPSGGDWADGRIRASDTLSVGVWGTLNRENLGGLGNFRSTPHVWSNSGLQNIGTHADGNQ